MNDQRLILPFDVNAVPSLPLFRSFTASFFFIDDSGVKVKISISFFQLLFAFAALFELRSVHCEERRRE